MRYPLLLMVFALLFLGAGACGAEPPVLRLATWNLEHLAADAGAGCRPRSKADYARLRHHARRLNADLIAVQEVENAAALARLFDPAVYALELSRRPDQDLGTCRRRHDQKQTMPRTGFAIHRARLAALGLRYRRLPDLATLGMKSQRRATRLLIEPAAGGGKGLRLLSLHLKAGCAYGRLEGGINRHQCRLLRQQRGILEEWIDARARAGEGFVLLGDFNRQLDQPGDDFWKAIDDGAVCRWVSDPERGRKCRPGTSRPNPAAELALANAGRPFPFPFNPRYPYAIDHIVLDAPTARGLVPESYAVLDYQGEKPAPRIIIR
ncbi:MAG: endonuclease/exonuclease/phosphatase family protein [Candidatus Thiosymbion ectosymbiont of Robbea hypermnestra]|nr:endonuclease/exonuclease/phosphatase family protein [Candidatus Thiosymbion ectosymbiont of Robbea hypermnestra]